MLLLPFANAGVYFTEVSVMMHDRPQRMRRSHRRVFDFLGLIALAMGVFRLLFIDDYRITTLLLNDRVLTYAMAMAVLAGIVYVTRNRFAIFMLNFLALTELTLELRDHFRDGHGLARDFSMSALWMGYGAMLMIIGFRRRVPFLRCLALALLGVTIFKVFFYDMSELQRVYRIVSFIGLGVLLLAISFAYQRKWLRVAED